jgi:Tat protein secretion system quality control protein TatD with DNase activity
MKYIDIHCHLDFKDYDADRQEVLMRMKEKGVEAITIGTDLKSSKRAVEIAEGKSCRQAGKIFGRVLVCILKKCQRCPLTLQNLKS